jgi:UDP-N-acetylmuramoyl-tripeptide--D-alanyl-D-alanine ligase
MSGAASERAVLWLARDAAAATGGHATQPFQARGVSIDSRTLSAGDLFVALHGERRDGHAFVGEAFAAGAAAAMVTQRPKGLDGSHPLLVVPDTYGGLLGLARAARQRSKARIVAVTGSVGKTGTKELIARALETRGPTSASVGNLNNQFGVPLSLARLAPGAAHAVFELGMNHAGEMEPLARLVAPQVALITTVQAVHLEFFGSIEGIADAKAEIFHGVAPGGAALINADDDTFARLKDDARRAGVQRVLSFGSAAGADARLLDWQPEEDGSRVEAEIAGRRLRYALKLAGRHWALNSVAALAAAECAGADPERAAAALVGLAPLKGRGARHRVGPPGGGLELIDESYNASPASIEAALATLALRTPGHGGRRIAVLGDMLELGPDGPRLHLALARPIAAAGIDLAFLCGPQMAGLFAALPAERRGFHAPDSAALLPVLQGALRAGDVVLVKGSLGSRMGLIVDALLAPEGAAETGGGGAL